MGKLRLLRIIPSVLLAIVAGDVVVVSASSGGARISSNVVRLWDLGLPSGGYVLAGFAVVAGAALALSIAWISAAVIGRHAPAHAKRVRDQRLGWDLPGASPGWERAPAPAFIDLDAESDDLLLRLQRAIAMNPILVPDRTPSAEARPSGVVSR
jgi:hypothetical protein